MELIGEIKTLQDSLDHTDISTTQRQVSWMNQTRVDRGNLVYDHLQKSTRQLTITNKKSVQLVKFLTETFGETFKNKVAPKKVNYLSFN